MIDIQQPPAIYLPYDGPLVRVLRPQIVVENICRLLGVKESGLIYGCQLWGEGGCLEFIADIPEHKQIEDHEDAHCNGWNHSN